MALTRSRVFTEERGANLGRPASQLLTNFEVKKWRRRTLRPLISTLRAFSALSETERTFRLSIFSAISEDEVLFLAIREASRRREYGSEKRSASEAKGMRLIVMLMKTDKEWFKAILNGIKKMMRPPGNA